MMASPSLPGSRCSLVWVLILGLPLVLVVAVGWAWFDRLQTLNAEIASRTEQLHRFQRVLRTLPRLRAELEQVSSNEELKSFYFDAPTPALAGAELQRRLQDIVQAADGRLISTQLLPSAPGEEPPRVRIRTQLQGTVETLLKVLLETEQARPLLFIDQVSIRSTARPYRSSTRRRRTVPQRQEGLLTIRLDVFGYALGGGQ
ncbi:General secretion pathway protein M [Thioflavicoccus mobilis 8321]|uniref:General secretion pathway protein M n=1 Tax=Thioflavicoccus mobilis 8321 TaxID=765912 RepID=L0GUE2_9GAMM|nr:type II secretion system protein GspM [Thioflavicoccus mobilis]AGA88929.1 General secretion pathway protein M [Thioflavicoccus mobilis 8321]